MLLSPAKMSLLVFLLSIAGEATAVSGKPPENDLFPVIVHHKSATCGTLVESQWLSDQKEYEAVFQAMFKGFMSDTKPQPATIDFDNKAMLLVSMGQQRTGGFSVTLASKQMEVADERAKIQVQWKTSKAGMVAIQMLTNPCLLLEVPRGNYTVIDVVDQSGKVQQSITVDQK
jgi:hypothetical protein